MNTYVRLQLSTGQVADLGPGDIIGRLDGATLRINEPEISEAHAMVSLRGERLVLLALRGRISVNNRPSSSAHLTPGSLIHLSPNLSLTVLHVVLPPSTLAVSAPGMPRPEVLRRATYAISVAGGALRLQPRFVPGAAAHLWRTPEGWCFAPSGGPARAVTDGDVLTVGRLTLALVSIPLKAQGIAPTAPVGALFPAMTLVPRDETVHILREGQPPVHLGGVPARLLCELIEFACPTPWRMLAGQLWPSTDDSTALRQRLDRGLSNLRRKLRSNGLRADLVQASGSGDYELLLYPGDMVQSA